MLFAWLVVALFPFSTAGALRFHFLTVVDRAQVRVLYGCETVVFRGTNLSYHHLNSTHFRLTEWNPRAFYLHGGEVRISNEHTVEVDTFPIIGTRECCDLPANDVAVFDHRGSTYTQMKTKLGHKVCVDNDEEDCTFYHYQLQKLARYYNGSLYVMTARCLYYYF
jgi:hypothetical protein